MSDEENMTEEDMEKLWEEADAEVGDTEEVAAASSEEGVEETDGEVSPEQPAKPTAEDALASADEIASKMEELKAQREKVTKGILEEEEAEEPGQTKEGVDLTRPDTTTKLVAADLDERRGEVTASTLGKLMGLATSNEMRLMEGKVDLLSTRMNSVIMKLEKMAVLIQDTPSATDLDRIDVQLASLRTLIKEVVDGSLQKALDAERKKAAQRDSDKSASEQKKSGSNIVSNNPNPPSQ